MSHPKVNISESMSRFMFFTVDLNYDKVIDESEMRKSFYRKDRNSKFILPIKHKGRYSKYILPIKHKSRNGKYY